MLLLLVVVVVVVVVPIISEGSSSTVLQTESLPQPGWRVVPTSRAKRASAGFQDYQTIVVSAPQRKAGNLNGAVLCAFFIQPSQHELSATHVRPWFRLRSRPAFYQANYDRAFWVFVVVTLDMNVVS